MDTEMLRLGVLIVGLGLIHWAVVPSVLERLCYRPKVFGPKAIWAIAIISLTCVGSLAYLLMHPDPDPLCD